MKILGISAFYHDSAAALIEDGRILVAAQEERFTRVKHDASFPKNSVEFCLKATSTRPDEIDAIVFYEKPFLKFERLVETYLAFAPRGFRSFATSMPLWLTEKLFQKSLLKDSLVQLGFSPKTTRSRIYFSDHHLSHAASAFYPSPFAEALVLTMDGVGEWTTTSAYLGKVSKLEKWRELHFPHSLGLLYSAFTYYCGFKVNSGEYKLMGLAPYGRPLFREKILKKLIDIKPDGSFRLDLQYFNYCTGLTMTNEKFNELFGGHFRKPEEPLRQVHMDLAASIQSVLEEVVLQLSRDLQKNSGAENLVLAGGVALNCVANGRLHREKIFKNIWIQPAAGDAGGALGAALAFYHLEKNHPRALDNSDQMRGAYLGPTYSNVEIEQTLRARRARFHQLSQGEILEKTAQALKAGKAIGWFQGAMEFGPRALGNRSILASPQTPGMQKNLNLKVKFRESFRPFAPAILAEEVQNWFDYSETSPYMLMVAHVLEKHRKSLASEALAATGLDLLNQERSTISAVTHVDYSARLQTVHRETNPKFHALISKFHDLTGCPVLVNTSFNIRGEPIVCSPEDAFRCFMGTHLDVLVVEDFWLEKQEQPAELQADHRHHFELD
ncbi:MAG: carbamoyltransferase [Bdellovibrionales bacterium]